MSKVTKTKRSYRRRKERFPGLPKIIKEYRILFKRGDVGIHDSSTKSGMRKIYRFTIINERNAARDFKSYKGRSIINNRGPHKVKIIFWANVAHRSQDLV